MKTHRWMAVLALALVPAVTACGDDDDDDGDGDGGAAIANAQSCLEDAGFEVRREGAPPEMFQALGIVDLLILVATDDAIGSGTVTYYDSDEAAQADLEVESAFTAAGVKGRVGPAGYYVLQPELATTIEACL
ncbi:hypothetical protein BH20ACT2_BH20ACT2_21300 [soil metagenome]